MVTIVDSIINTVLFDKEIIAKRWIKDYQPQLTDSEVNDTFETTLEYIARKQSKEELNSKLCILNVDTKKTFPKHR